MIYLIYKLIINIYTHIDKQYNMKYIISNFKQKKGINKNDNILFSNKLNQQM